MSLSIGDTVDELPTNPEPSSNQSSDLVPTPSLEPLLAPPAPKRGVRWVFIGKSGIIRAGWGIALFIVIFIGCAVGIGFLVRAMLHAHPHPGAVMTPRMGIISEGLQLFCIIIATGVLALIERKSLFAYGFQGAARAVRFFSGLVWGFVAISVLIFALWKAHLLVFDGLTLHGPATLHYALLWGLMFLLVGLSEESLLRGYVQYTMTRGIGFWWGALIFSFLFGFGHHSNVGESPVGLVAAGAIGFVFCLSIWYTGSLWWAVGFHTAWDWGESYFYGTSDSGLIVRGHLLGEHPTGKLLWSGGLTGPEGSLLIIPLILIIAVCMWFWWGSRVQSPFAGQGWRPAWSRKSRALDPGNVAAGTAPTAG